MSRVRTAMQYVQRHPWQAAEHLLLCAALLLLLMSRCPNNAPLTTSPGPLNILDDAPLVHKAPPPTMDVTGLAPGQALQAGDARGDIYRLVLQAPRYVVNAYFTRAVHLVVRPRTTTYTHTQGFKRSGDLHNCTQYDVLLSGTALLTTLERGADVVHTYHPHELIAIPPRVPHLFEFLEDSFLVEW